MQHFFAFTKYTKSLVNSFSQSYHVHVTEKPFLNITRKQLADPHYMNQVLETNIPKHSRRAMRSIFHGKETKSGNYFTEFRNAKRRLWRPNVFERNVYSEVLGRKLNLKFSTKALRCIRKYGGFDNYILLTKPKNMDSLYGEYLRKLMMTKLNDSSYQIPYITKSLPFEGKNNSNKHRYSRRPKIFHPKDQRYTDLTKDRIKLPNEMSKKELAVFNELEELSGSFQDTQTSHPLLKEVEQDTERQMALLEEDRQKVIAQWERKKSHKKKERVLAIFESAAK